MTEALTFVASVLACNVACVFGVVGLVVLVSALHEAGIRRAVRRHIESQAKGGWR